MIEIEKPRIECIETPTADSYGKYVVEPLERGYGTTLGNSLRRVLLSSLPGTAVTSIKNDAAQTAAVENFSKSQYLKDFRWNTLGMRWMKDCNAANLSDCASLTSDQARVQSNLYCYMWNSDLTGVSENNNYLSNRCNTNGIQWR